MSRFDFGIAIADSQAMKKTRLWLLFLSVSILSENAFAVKALSPVFPNSVQPTVWGKLEELEEKTEPVETDAPIVLPLNRMHSLLEGGPQVARELPHGPLPLSREQLQLANQLIHALSLNPMFRLLSNGDPVQMREMIKPIIESQMQPSKSVITARQEKELSLDYDLSVPSLRMPEELIPEMKARSSRFKAFFSRDFRQQVIQYRPFQH